MVNCSYWDIINGINCIHRLRKEKIHMELKIYHVNEFDTVISHLSLEETNDWYKEEYELDDIDQPLEEVEEVNYTDDGYWEEHSAEEILDILKYLINDEEVKIKKMDECYFIFVSFQDIIDNLSEYEEPYVLCSTEW
jgi:hypothetical protein